MQISRRNALVGAGAAAVVAVAPGAVLGDPVVALVNKAFACRDLIDTTVNNRPDILDEELDALCEPYWEMLNQVRLTPATSVQGIAAKTRVAWIQMHQTIEHEQNGIPEDSDLIGKLEPERFIWSVLEDFERLLAGMRP